MLARLPAQILLDFPGSIDIQCLACGGAGNVYRVKTAVVVIGGKRRECAECGGTGQVRGVPRRKGRNAANGPCELVSRR
jgi:DnaJ-class molecular chaperone